MSGSNLPPTLILAGALIIAGFLAGGIYQGAPLGSGLLVLNRFTGANWFCTGDSCHPLGGKFSNPG